MRRRAAVVAHRKGGTGAGLERGGGQVEQQLAQMRTPLDAAQVALDGLAPAAPQRLADQAAHRLHRLWAGVVRVRIHGHRDVADHHRVVQRHADVHVVDRLVGCPLALAFDFEGMGFGVQHFAFDVP